MKKNFLRKISAIVLTFTLVSAGVPSYALEREEKFNEPCYSIDEQSEAFYNWLENGRKGRMPSNTDADSINRSLSMRPATYTLLPESYDVRSRGGVEPVSDCYHGQARGVLDCQV